MVKAIGEMTDDDPNEAYEVVPIEPGPHGPPKVGGRSPPLPFSVTRHDLMEDRKGLCPRGENCTERIRPQRMTVASPPLIVRTIRAATQDHQTSHKS